MKSELTFFREIAEGWSVEYRLTSDGGGMEIAVESPFWRLRLKGEQVAALHEALHDAEKAAPALDLVATKTLQWNV